MIPKKLYYSISEVCSITGLEQHVLRYWETEFTQLKPKKNRAGNRAYREKDIEVIQFIKHLLYEEKYTIPGAKKKISESGIHLDTEPDLPQEQPEIETQPLTFNTPVEEIRKELREILDFIKNGNTLSVGK